jgi:hypothetical protein
VAKGFAVDIEDRGLGMDDEEFADINANLANPPLFDPSGSDRFGLFVAAQLARRHGIRAKLRRSDYGGVTAIVLIPLSLVMPANALGDGRTPGRAANGRVTTASRQVTAPPVAAAPLPSGDQPGVSPANGDQPPAFFANGDQPAGFSTNGGQHAMPPASGDQPAAPSASGDQPATPSASGDQPAARPGNGDQPTTPDAWELAAASPAPQVPRPRPTPSPTPISDLPEPASGLDAEPAWSPVATAPDEAPPPGSRFGLTENGLPQRVRQMSLAPQLRERAASPSFASAAASSRSPETARDVMSAFRRGWRRGLSDADSQPDHRSDLPQEGE